MRLFWYHAMQMRSLAALILSCLLLSGCSTPPPEIKSTELLIITDPEVESGMQKLVSEFLQSPYSADEHSKVIPILKTKSAWETLDGFKNGSLQPDFLITPGEAFTRTLNIFSGNLSSKFDTCTPLGSLSMSIAVRSPMRLDALPESFSLSAESPEKSSEGFFALGQKNFIRRYLDINTTPLSLFTTDGLLTTQKNLDNLKRRLPEFSKKFPETINNISSIPFILCRATGGARTKERLIASGRLSTFIEQKLPTLTPDFFGLEAYKSETSIKESDVISIFKTFENPPRSIHFLIDASGSMSEDKRFSQVLDLSRIIENQKGNSKGNTLSLFSTNYSSLDLSRGSVSEELSKISPKGDFLTEDAFKNFFLSVSKIPQNNKQKDLVIITDGTGIKSLNSIIPIFEQASSLPHTHTFLIVLDPEILPMYSPIERLPFVTVLGYEAALQVFRGL